MSSIFQVTTSLFSEMPVRADEILTLLASEIKFEPTGPDIPDDPDEHFQRSLQLHDQGDSDRAKDRKTRWIYTKEEVFFVKVLISTGLRKIRFFWDG